MNQDENNPCSHGAYTQRVKLFFWVPGGVPVRVAMTNPDSLSVAVRMRGGMPP